MVVLLLLIFPTRPVMFFTKAAKMEYPLLLELTSGRLHVWVQRTKLGPPSHDVPASLLVHCKVLPVGITATAVKVVPEVTQLLLRQLLHLLVIILHVYQIILAWQKPNPARTAFGFDLANSVIGIRSGGDPDFYDLVAVVFRGGHVYVTLVLVAIVGLGGLGKLLRYGEVNIFSAVFGFRAARIRFFVEITSSFARCASGLVDLSLSLDTVKGLGRGKGLWLA